MLVVGWKVCWFEGLIVRWLVCMVGRFGGWVVRWSGGLVVRWLDGWNVWLLDGWICLNYFNISRLSIALIPYPLISTSTLTSAFNLNL